MAIIVQDRQSLLDVSMQYFGSANVELELAVLNNISPVEILEAGQEIELPETSNYKEETIGNYFLKNTITPATALSNYDTQIINNDDPCDICKFFQ